MKTQFLLCITTLLLFFTSCSKRTESPISDATAFGHVFDKFTQEPILGAEVHLFQSEFTSFFSPDRITYLETTLTDKDGFFEFQFEELDFPFSHFVYVEEHGFFPEQKDAEKNMEILLEPQASLQLHVKNVNPFNELDTIKVKMSCINTSYLIGTNIDTVFLCNDAPSEKYINVIYWISKNGNKQQFVDSIFTSLEHDLHKYYIEH